MAAIVRFDPFRDLQRIQARMNRLFDEVFGRRAARPAEEPATGGGFTPAVDLWETPEAYLLRAELPGVSREDVQIEVTDNTLVLRGERKMGGNLRHEDWLCQEGSYGPFYRALTLPGSIEADKIQARVQNGVLEVIIPKAEEAKTKVIPIAA
ncbi:MAG TPA: Hsp20/alpha crystallin family protein [Thermodesulfobacteriota bacterium]|nr:Hsp20/alpha crystallin family protein [Thermodesulfobacteriota bacterium]